MEQGVHSVGTVVLTYQSSKKERTLMKKYMGVDSLESAWTSTMMNKFPWQGEEIDAQCPQESKRSQGPVVVKPARRKLWGPCDWQGPWFLRARSKGRRLTTSGVFLRNLSRTKNVAHITLKITYTLSNLLLKDSRSPEGRSDFAQYLSLLLTELEWSPGFPNLRSGLLV